MRPVISILRRVLTGVFLIVSLALCAGALWA